MKECLNVWSETGRIISEKEERAWFAAFIIEFSVIFLLNAFSLAIYTRNRHLRKPGTYLIINLTVADLMVGTTFVLLSFFVPDKPERDVVFEQAFSWQPFVYLTSRNLFPAASLANISLISLQRLHATLFPFRHCLIGRQLYLTTIFCSWLFSLTLSSVSSLLDLLASLATSLYVNASYIFLSLLILTVSYVIIISTVKTNPPSPNAGPALSKERKLTMTLFTVTAVSVLTILPWTIWTVIALHIQSKLCPAVSLRIYYSIRVIYFFNSIVNPVIYAIRMQEFRKAARKLFLPRDQN